MRGIINGLIPSIAIWAVLIFVAFYVTGCGSTRGWQVSFGVHPVSETSKTEKLNDKGVK